MKKALMAVLVLAVLGVGALLAAYRVGLYTGVAPHEGVRAVTGATLVDGTGAEPVEDAVVVIRDGRIEAAGAAGEVAVPDGAEVLQADGLTLVPGLVDAHVHFGAPEVDNYEEWEDLSLLSILWDSIRMSPGKRRAFVEHGVTTIASAGDSDEWILGLRDAVAEDDLEGPRVVAAGPLFTAPGGHPAGTIFEDVEFMIETATRQVDEPAVAREEVAGVAELGVDFVKAVVDRGRPEYGGELPALAPEVLEAVVEAAGERGLPVSVHWSHADEAETAVRAGARSLQHAGFGEIDADLARLIVEADVMVVPTLAVVEALVPDILDAALANTALLHRAGARIVAGSDAANPGVRFGDGLHRELELLVEAGLSPGEALRAATADAARHLEMEDEIGTVEPGKRADLVGVVGDPLTTISALRDVKLVLRDGKLLVDETGE